MQIALPGAMLEGAQDTGREAIRALAIDNNGGRRTIE
jgi:hypothetical protein